jgi:hypothetical protein
LGKSGGTNKVITKDDIASFRVGNFKDASENIKTKWYMVMLGFLPSISRKYNTPALRASDLATNLTSASDEAFLFWCLCLFGQKWSTNEAGCNQNKDIDEDEEASPPVQKKRKTGGPHVARTHQDLFWDLFITVTEARCDEVLRETGWDEALKEKAEQELLKGNGNEREVDENHENYSSPKKERTIYVARLLKYGRSGPV